jgi:hypothetical protein
VEQSEASAISNAMPPLSGQTRFFAYRSLYRILFAYSAHMQ